ncbi:16S rRNA (cytosine(1402)-N(4))-methyltransferase [Candidatus Campbellbacteria bacterium CG11_big_fil_rev_8_21_14_0_20_44_21]|uniref:Ribosomal RNA small subunit methyltransferase H n=1 Tax=Candidatus Campbellbacteria bacterium CG22_combo_CG10-13_8_21_14_all_43_18 TaxID=1974530 RepID=A0A2H0DW35_9BACT|nr:MAG: 16S rRNA (cytosine(1402)-N(4))-methyltransferase [Candidatus Campbellbacteria bacterium CG22_combo_CG10-13_8_21_14_all_43_18]PIR24288.1 MAG: 16S rRNA (cytosine(1402)-N(4))-methyltransferase [Candidatus Campbellbacteria bacterium CG11_big_fil_rev_8_21_14_0_20_44_21]
MLHKSVLLDEVLSGLQPPKGGIFVDATIGSAGHALALSKIIGKKGLLIGIEADPERAQKSLKFLEKGEAKKIVVNKNFREIKKILDQLKIKEVDGILFDLGLNSEQLESSGRGFSFQKNEPLLMNFGENPKFTAKDIVNDWAEENISQIIWGFGGEKFARRIAKKIVERRKEKKLETTEELVKIIQEALPKRQKKGQRGGSRSGKKIHPATKTFQALRIAVNEELPALEEGLKDAFEKLRNGGRMAVISFHQLEDRLVKKYFRKLKEEGLGKILFKKPITPKIKELRENPRSRSAKLRIIEKI